MESSNRKYLSSHIKVVPKTRNQRFREALEKNHSKVKVGGRASTDKKLAKLRERSSNIKLDPIRAELLEWITEIQHALKYTDQQFADAIGVHKKTVQNWRGKVGYMPNLKNFKVLLRLEKLTRVSIVIRKNKNYFIKEKSTIRVVIN